MKRRIVLEVGKIAIATLSLCLVFATPAIAEIAAGQRDRNRR